MPYEFLKEFVYRTPSNHFNSSEEFMESIYIASPILYRESLKKSELIKTKISLKKYQQRSSIRCTPFGLFAGCGVGSWGEDNMIIRDFKYRLTRLDMNVVCELASIMLRHKEIKKHLVYYKNNSLYKINGRYRYVEYFIKNSSRNYQITSVESSSYINQILCLVENGANYFDLVKCVVSFGVNEIEAELFLDELVSSQLIVSNLYPNLTGINFFDEIIDILFKIKKSTTSNEVAGLYSLLCEIKNDINELDKSFHNPVLNYEKIHEKIKQIIPSISEENLLQSDLYFISKNASIKTDIQEQLIESILFLSKLFPNDKNDNIEIFKKKFTEKYGEREMPILIALDDLNGIGYLNNNSTINFLIDDLPDQKDLRFKIKWDSTNSLLLRKITESNIDKSGEITLTDEDIIGANSIHELPASIPLHFSVVSKKRNEIYLKGAGGSSAGTLISRFAGGQKGVSDILSQISQHEMHFYNNKIIAEIVHLPENRAGNILLRPGVYNYEIPYLAKGSSENIINLDNVYISVTSNKVILRSKTDSKEIIPRLTTAHNYTLSSLPLYRFLCDLQTQYYSNYSFRFTWGILEKEFSFLPRVTYKNVILSPRTWIIHEEKIQELGLYILKDNIEKILEWAKDLELPFSFVLSDGDNELFVNLEDEISVHAFNSVIKKRKKIKLQEFLYDVNDSLIHDSKGESCTNEIIATILNHNKNVIDNSHRSTFINENVQRKFLLGSEWLYYKIYGNSREIENILIEKLLPLILSLKNKNVLKKWFFVRYNDTLDHVRLRLQISDLEYLSEVQLKICDLLTPLLANESVNNLLTILWIEKYK